MNDKPKVGIKEQITIAASEAEVRSLLTRVKSFHNAHPSTVRKCERAAEKRIAQLNSEAWTKNNSKS